MKKLNLLTFLIVISIFTYAQQVQKGSVAYYESMRIAYQTKIDWVNSNPEEKALAEQNHWFEMANANVQKMIDYKYLAEQSKNGIYLSISNSNRSLNEYTPQGGGPICSEAAPICLGNTYEWPCGVDVPPAEAGPDYGCLASEPNPAWYYFQIENSGDIVMGMDAPNDVDYVIWGPFTEGPNCDYADLQMEYVVDCSYSSTNTESPEIGPNSSEGPTTATAGEWYMMMITNYSNQVQNFSFYQTGGTGSTNCSIVCPITGLVLDIDNCDFTQNGNNYFTEYSLFANIELFEASNTDSLIIEKNGVSIQSYYPPFSSPILFEQNGLTADGSTNDIKITVYLNNGDYCNNTKIYTAPEPIRISTQDICQSSNLGSVIINMDSYGTYNNSFVWNIGEEEQISSSVYVNDSLNIGTYQVTITSDYNPACTYIIDDIVIEDMGADCSIVSGNIYADGNEDCNYDINDVLIPNVILQFEPLNIYTITDELGYYSVNLPYGDYTINEGGYDNILPSCTESQALELSLDSSIPQVSFDIANDNNGFVADLEVINFGIGFSRPGFHLTKSLLIRNNSCINSFDNVEVNFSFNPILNYTNARLNGQLIQYQEIYTDSICFVIPHLGSYETKILILDFYLPSSANLGDTLYSSVNIQLSGGVEDYQTNNNFAEAFRVIQGSYDPNFVEINNVPNQTEIYLEDSTLTYTIHFQNTGTDTAFNVVVVDTIPEELNLLTFVAGASSHPYIYEIENGRKLKFTFSDILLPDSNVNEAMSHAFVSFSIRQNENNQIGDFITSKADIYFDFNEAVSTELLETEIVDNNVSIDIKNKVSNIHIFPNPAKEIVTIDFENQQSGIIQIYSLSGQLMVEQIFKNSNKENINIKTFNRGVYLVKVQDSKTSELKKLIVE